MFKFIKQGLLPGLKGVNHVISRFRALGAPHLLYSNNGLQLLKAKRLLIIAPHMDDEVIGCGGLIALTAARGAVVVCVYMTDSREGRAGKEGTVWSHRRQEETRQAGLLLGVKKRYFLNEIDGALQASPPVVKRVADIIAHESPDHIFYPYPYDPHPDHREVFSVIRLALAEIRRPWPALWFYQIQVSLPRPHLSAAVDITSVWETKRQAMAVYESQTNVPFDVIQHFQQCQRYWLGGTTQAAEVFGNFSSEAQPWQDGISPWPTGAPVKRFSEVGLCAIRRQKWI